MQCKKGFMLLELMVSLAILSTGLLTVTRSFISSLGASNYSQQYTLACTLAEEKLNELGQSTDLSEGTTQGSFEEPYLQFSWELEIKPSSNDSLKHVTITVIWKEKGKQRKAKLATLILKNPEE
jgi:type II secretion system protein I